MTALSAIDTKKRDGEEARNDSDEEAPAPQTVARVDDICVPGCVPKSGTDQQ